MAGGDSFAEFLREQLAPMAGLSLRRMFGKTAVFCDGLMFGLVSEEALYLRVDAGNEPGFRAAGQVMPFRYVRQGRAIDLAYWRVPDGLLDEPAELVAWARAALAAARRAAAARAPRKRQLRLPG